MNHTSGRGALLLVIVGVLLAALTIDTSDTQAQGEMPFFHRIKKMSDTSFCLLTTAGDTVYQCILDTANGDMFFRSGDGYRMNFGEADTVFIDSLVIDEWISLNGSAITSWPAAGGMDSAEVMIVIRDTGYVDSALTAIVARDSSYLNDTAAAIRANVRDTAILVANDSSTAVRADIRDTIGVITDIDSANVSANGLSLSDMDWDYERVYLTNVHSFANALEDSIYLYDHVHLANGDTLLLVIDSAGNITANDRDTVSISGYVPYACTIDSVLIRYMTGAEIIDGYLKGPDVSAGDNMVDSTYVSWATDLTSATWATAEYDITDIAASAGDRFAYKYVVNFGADNERLRIGWIALVVKR